MSPTLSPVVDVQTLAQFREQHTPLTIIDVRTSAEFESAHIPGSYHIALDQLPDYSEELAETLKTPVVLVCRSGTRAREAEQVLRSTSLTNLHILDGGLGAWEAARMPVRRGRQRWSLERQVRGVAGAAVLASIVGSIFWPPLLALAGIMGAGLGVSALTDSCTMALLLSKLPYNRAAACDVQQVLQSLAASEQSAGT